MLRAGQAAPQTPAVLEILLQPKQRQIWELLENSDFTNIGFGGARGGGKSHGGRNVLLLRAMKYPGTRHMIFRRTFEELWKNHISKLIEQHPITAQWYSAQHRSLRVPTGRGKPPSFIDFVYAEHKGDIYKHQGAEWATQLRDEATHLNEEEHRFLDTCLRYVGPLSLTPKVIYTTNPGLRGHDYIKRIFIQKKYRANERPADYTFLQSYSWDNVGWFQKELTRDQISVKEFYGWTNEKRFQYFVSRTDYGRQLNSLPETERLQYLMGDWDVFEGQYFSEFRRDLHVIQAFRIPAFWERFCAADWGYTSPACNLWFAVSPDEWVTIRQLDGRQVMIPPRSLVAYRESYERKKTSKELGTRWVDLTAHEPLRYKMLDPAFGPTRGGGVSVAEELASAGWATNPADNDRLQGWSRVRQYLSWRRDPQSGSMTAWPHLYFFENCENLIRTLPGLIHDEHNVEDVDSEGEDHAADALRYGCMSRPPLTVEPLDAMEQELVEAEMRALHNQQGSPGEQAQAA